MNASKPAICHLVLSLGVGGTEHLVCEMCRDLARDYSIVICCLDEPGLWGKTLRKEGFVVYALYRSPGIDLAVVFQLAKIFERHRVALIHAHQYSPFFYGALSRIFYPQARLLFMEHGRHWPEVKKPWKNIFNRIVLQPLTHEIVAVSKEVRERLVTYEGLSRKRIRVIYNGIKDIYRLSTAEKKALRSHWGLGADDFVVATVGRLDPIKNLPMFLLALAMASQGQKSLRGLIVGDGPERPRLEDFSQRLGLRDQVIFTGFREDAVRLLQMADVFVLSSFSEGTSLALLEAMAAGLPSVVTAVGGNPEVVEDGKTGLVVPSGDAVKLAAALSLLAERKDVVQQMGQAARRRFERYFHFDKMMQAYRRLYQEMVAEKCVA